MTYMRHVLCGLDSEEPETEACKKFFQDRDEPTVSYGCKLPYDGHSENEIIILKKYQEEYGSVSVWRWRTSAGEKIPSYENIGTLRHGAEVISVCADASNRFISTTSVAGTIRIWDIEKMGRSEEHDRQYKECSAPLQGLASTYGLKIDYENYQIQRLLEIEIPWPHGRPTRSSEIFTPLNH